LIFDRFHMQLFTWEFMVINRKFLQQIINLPNFYEKILRCKQKYTT